MKRMKRFYAKILRKPNGCIEWTAGRESEGYGWFHIGYENGKQKNQVAHKYLWEQLYGKVPEGKELHHICENKLCVNPKHLRIVTRKEHLSVCHISYQSKKTHCVHGHEFTAENTRLYPWDGKIKRACRECERRRKREAYWRRMSIKENT